MIVLLLLAACTDGPEEQAPPPGPETRPLTLEECRQLELLGYVEESCDKLLLRESTAPTDD